MYKRLYGLFAQITLILALLSLWVLGKWPSIVAPVVILLVIFFTITWFIYFYRIWKIERSSVTYTKVRQLSEEEKSKLLEELQKLRNSTRNLLISSAFFIVSVFFFIQIFSFSEAFKNSGFGIISSWVLLFLIFGSLGVLILSALKIDRKFTLEKDLREGVVKIEGPLYKVNLSTTQLDTTTRESRTSSIKSIRMGKYDFSLNDEKLTHLYKDVIDGDSYKILFSPGTKKIWKIEKI